MSTGSKFVKAVVPAVVKIGFAIFSMIWWTLIGALIALGVIFTFALTPVCFAPFIIFIGSLITSVFYISSDVYAIIKDDEMPTKIGVIAQIGIPVIVIISSLLTSKFFASIANAFEKSQIWHLEGF